jgi:hypothetical protein
VASVIVLEIRTPQKLQRMETGAKSLQPGPSGADTAPTRGDGSLKPKLEREYLAVRIKGPANRLRLRSRRIGAIYALPPSGGGWRSRSTRHIVRFVRCSGGS